MSPRAASMLSRGSDRVKTAAASRESMARPLWHSRWDGAKGCPVPNSKIERYTLDYLKSPARLDKISPYGDNPFSLTAFA
jgi:hypothetical protein